MSGQSGLGAASGASTAQQPVNRIQPDSLPPPTQASHSRTTILQFNGRELVFTGIGLEFITTVSGVPLVHFCIMYVPPAEAASRVATVTAQALRAPHSGGPTEQLLISRQSTTCDSLWECQLKIGY